IKHATSTGIMWHCENNLEQGSRIQVIVKERANAMNVIQAAFARLYFDPNNYRLRGKPDYKPVS
ncbi:MAG: hypothetical protein K2L86_16380, partial [Lachnospiraceae bacterium]|nr:hypothetical protein [Lachnospiraceae bacterium]